MSSTRARGAGAVAARIGLIGLLLACLAGCVGPNRATPGSTAPGAGAMWSRDALKPDLSRELRLIRSTGPAPLLDAPPTGRWDSVPWKFMRFIGGHGEIEIAYVQGDGYCVTPLGFRVVQVGSAVELSAVSRNNGDAVCGSSLVLGRTTIALPVPVGGTGRDSLLHAPVSPDWSSGNYFN